ncbi:MAG: hypothetical protein IPK52_20595, partial [Chloroflexi bacterium]|nr:hypothetical protein [Chloroflexota bacterium]
MGAAGVGRIRGAVPAAGGRRRANWIAPLAGAVILFGSGLYQYSRGWRVAPVIWIGGSLMLVSVYYGSQMDPTRDLIGFTLLVFA